MNKDRPDIAVFNAGEGTNIQPLAKLCSCDRKKDFSSAFVVNAETLYYTLGYLCAERQQQVTEIFYGSKIEWSLSYELHTIQTPGNLASAHNRNGSCNTISPCTKMKQTVYTANLLL